MTARKTEPTGLQLAIGIVCVTMAAMTLPSLQAAMPDQAVRFEILDGFDVVSDGFGEYVDHRLLDNTDDPSNDNFCVETSISGGGFTFIGLNRAIGGSRCDEAGIPGAMKRWYALNIADAAACEELEGNGNASDTDGDPNTYETCVADGNRNPRIRVDRLRQNGGSTTIDFLMGRKDDWGEGDLTYEIQSVGQATVVPDGGGLVLGYDGLFRLARFGLPKTKGKPGSGPPPPPEVQFQMSVEMRFQIASF